MKNAGWLNRVLATAFGLFSAAVSFAGPVVVTPGSQAGYLYFNPAGAGAGSGGQNITVTTTTFPRVARVTNPTVEAGECFNANSIGQKCKWGDGTLSVYAGASPAGTGRTKLYAAVEDEASVMSWGCYQVNTKANTTDGLLNTNLVLRVSSEMNACATSQAGSQPPVPFWACNEKGQNYFLPSSDELKVVLQSRALIGGFKTGTQWWSSNENGGDGALSMDSALNVTYVHKVNGSYAVRCVRGF